MKRPAILGTVVAVAVLGLIAAAILRASSVTINLQPFSTTFNAPVGIDFWGPPHRQLITTENYPGPVQPRQIDPVTGVNTPFPVAIPGTLDNEIKISTVQASACMGGFQANDVFFPNGQPGQIVRVTDNGATVQDPWVTLPAPGDIQIRGSMFQDRYCAFGGDLIVVTGYEQSFFNPDLSLHGSVWRVNSSGVATLIVDLKKHLEGVIVVPNDPVKYGLLAGRILAGDEDRQFGASGEQLNGSYGKIFAIKSAADVFYIGQNADPNYPSYQFYPVATPLQPEDLDIVPHGDPTIPGDGDLFGIDYGGGRILRAPASDFATFCGELLVTQEIPATGTSGLSFLRSGPSGFDVVTIVSSGANPTQWEHVTFSGSSDCPPPPPPPHIKIVKLTNGVDANNPDAAGVPQIAPGATVTWTYAVTNDGVVDIPESDITVTDNIVGAVSVIVNKGNGDAILSPGETWLYQKTGIALDLTTAPGANIVPNQCHEGNASNPGGSAYTNQGTVTIPSMSASDPDSYCNPPPPPPPPCPGGSFTFSVDANGDLNIVYDQFPAPNDNSYGANAVGWGTHGHKFSDLVGSDHAGFQLVDPSGVVKLDFNIDYLTAKTGTPSGYASLGPFGGDGKINVGTLTSSDVTFDSSLARNLNTLGYFSGGVQVVGNSVANLLLDSPPTLNTTDSYTLTPAADAVFHDWNFHDTYFVTIKAAKLAALGFNPATWKVQPNLDELHNSPAKPCPVASGGSCNVITTAKKLATKEVQITVQNTGSADAILTAVNLTWPSANGKLMQVKLDGNIVYDSPDILPPSANLTTAQLVADPNKRTIKGGLSPAPNHVIHFVFEKNVDTNAAHYSGTLTFSSCVLTVLP
jgi:hypothetical protein